jgi:hypothetical protein
VQQENFDTDTVSRVLKAAAALIAIIGVFVIFYFTCLVFGKRKEKRFMRNARRACDILPIYYYHQRPQDDARVYPLEHELVLTDPTGPLLHIQAQQAR